MNNKTTHEITVIRVHHKTAASCIIRSLLCGPQNEYRGYQRQECHLGAIYHKGRINDTFLSSDLVYTDYDPIKIHLQK